jgi:hypothetical protein
MSPRADGLLPRLPKFDWPTGWRGEGRWTVRLGGVHITGDAYSVSRAGDSVAISLDVTEPWKPSGLPLGMKIFTGIIRKFRLWLTTYRWRSNVRDANNAVQKGTTGRRIDQMPPDLNRRIVTGLRYPGTERRTLTPKGPNDCWR